MLKLLRRLSFGSEAPADEQRQMVVARETAVSPIPRRSPIIIDMTPSYQEQVNSLSNYLLIGRAYHPLCRNQFVGRKVTGYYYYERRIHLSTCAVAAAYAGAFGADAIEGPEFSLSMATWRLSKRVGYSLTECKVTGPTGRRNSVADEMTDLVDKNWWTRQGVAEWLMEIGL